jgi:hypothetical protein
MRHASHPSVLTDDHNPLRRDWPRLKLAEGAAARQFVDCVVDHDPLKVVLYSPVTGPLPCARAKG